MAKRGRPPILDEIKRREILAILSVGCSRTTAAGYVGCSVSTIQNTAERDPKFSEELRRAESRAEITFLQAIQKAARDERHWRAAAWVLERKHPEQYGRRKADALSVEQVKALLEQFAQAVVEQVPAARYRQKILKQLDRVLARLGKPPKRKSKAKSQDM